MITKSEMDNLKWSPIGNPHKMAMGGMQVGIPNAVAGLPGMTGIATRMIKREIDQLDFPDVPEFLEMITAAGGQLYACKMSADMFKLDDDDLYEDVEGIIGATDFIEMSDGAQVIFI